MLKLTVTLSSLIMRSMVRLGTLDSVRRILADEYHAVPTLMNT